MGVWVSRLCLGLGRLRVQKQPGHRAGDTEGCRGRRGRALRGHVWVQLGVGKPGRLLWTLRLRCQVATEGQAALPWAGGGGHQPGPTSLGLGQHGRHGSGTAKGPQPSHIH